MNVVIPKHGGILEAVSLVFIRLTLNFIIKSAHQPFSLCLRSRVSTF